MTVLGRPQPQTQTPPPSHTLTLTKDIPGHLMAILDMYGMNVKIEQESNLVDDNDSQLFFNAQEAKR